MSLDNRETKQFQQQLLSEAEASFYLGVSRPFLAKSRMDGDIPGRTPGPPFLKIGRMIRYHIDDLNEWIASYRAAGRFPKQFPSESGN